MTSKAPYQAPALKISPIAEQLLMKTSKNRKIDEIDANSIIFFIMSQQV